MIETNIRIVAPGSSLWIAARRAIVKTTHQNPDLTELACLRLRARYGLAAVPGLNNTLIVATTKQIPDLCVRDENSELTIEDGGDIPRLTMNSDRNSELMASLVERALLTTVAARTKRWNIWGTPRYWYEPKPFSDENGVFAFRRSAISAFHVEDTGIGVAVDVQSAFFSKNTLAWFFDSRLSDSEASSRRELFLSLAHREHGEGTLLYTRGTSRSTCYFSEAPQGLTCESTGVVRAGGVSYNSLFEYYQKTSPTLQVEKNEPAVYVMFRGLEKAQPVAARFLRLRVFNDALPRKLQKVSQIRPGDRRLKVISFWSELGEKPLGSVAPGILPNFWTPAPKRHWRIPPPPLHFGHNKVLQPPSDADGYRDYFNSRSRMLREAGCYRYPPAAPRQIVCAHPEYIASEIVDELLSGLKKAFGCWTGLQFTSTASSYARLEDGIESVRKCQPNAMVLFIINNERTAYYDVSLELGDRRPKRLVVQTLLDHHRGLVDGLWDHRDQAMSARRGRHSWESFIALVALDLLQLHDGVPWSVPATAFEAMVVIDVSHDRRHFGLSLLTARQNDRLPFHLSTVIKPKIDSQHEAINKEVLEEELARAVKCAWPAKTTPLTSILFIRDGRLCGDEIEAIRDAKAKLVAAKILADNAIVEVVEFFKDSNKHIRIWDVDSNGKTENVIEGTAVEVTRKLIVLADTGRATLSQGTAEPVSLIGRSQDSKLRESAAACFSAAQLNWSNPRVAQRLPLPVSRTDEQLLAQAQQEARHYR